MKKKVLVLYPKKTYIDALLSVGVKPVFDLEKPCDGLMLTGGGDVSPSLYGKQNTCSINIDNERDRLEFSAIKKYLSLSKPIFGICRGLQIVNVFLGGTLYERVFNHDQICDKDRYHVVDTVKGGVTCSLYGKSFFVNSAHRQAVDRVAKSLSVDAVSRDGIIECLTYKNLLLTQFHPERLCYSGQKLMLHFAKML